MAPAVAGQDKGAGIPGALPGRFGESSVDPDGIRLNPGGGQRRQAAVGTVACAGSGSATVAPATRGCNGQHKQTQI